MAITPLPAVPQRSDTPANFITKADAFIAALPQFATEANAQAAALTLNATTDTSTTSNAIGLGAKTFTVSTGKSFQPGMYLVIADTAAPSTNSLSVQVTSYNSSTGALVVNSLAFSGTGTKTAWTISQTAVFTPLDNSVSAAKIQTDAVTTEKILDANVTNAKIAFDGGSLSGFRNKLINGKFRVNQLVLSGSVVLAAGAYGHDQWKAGAGGCTYTFATVDNVTTLTITAGTLQQVIEGDNLETGTHILSWTGTATGKIGAGALSASGVTGSVTGGTNLTIEFSTGTLTKVQLELGVTATPFETRNFGQELLFCKRYFEKSYDYAVALGAVTDAGASTVRTSAAAATLIPGLDRRLVEKQASPTITWYSSATGTVNRVRNVTGAADLTVTGSDYAGRTSTGYPAVSAGVADAAIIVGHWTASARL